MFKKHLKQVTQSGVDIKGRHPRKAENHNGILMTFDFLTESIKNYMFL